MNLIVYKKYLMGFLQFSLDVIVLSISFLLAFFLKKVAIFPDPQLSSVGYMKLFIVVLPFLMSALYFSKLYSLRVILLPWKGWLKTAAKSVISMFVILIVFSFYLKMFSYSRMVFTLFLLIFFPLLILSRVILNPIYLRSILKNNEFYSSVVLFTDSPGQKMIDRIRRLYGCTINEIYLGQERKLDVLELEGIRQGVTGGVFIDMDSCRFPDIAAILERANREGVSAYLSPRSLNQYESNVSVESLGDQAVIVFYPNHIPSLGWVMKRSVDLIISFLAILFLSPVMALIACTIKFTSTGPVIFRQTRVGFGGRLFTMFKFRSMNNNAEADTGPVWASEHDNRVTKVGRFLRRTNLDELPQLLNVFLGDMSLVGPRPERPEFVNSFKEQIRKYSHKHWVRPGITGWAQINGWRGNTSIVERIKCDLFYIENWSWWIDLKILVYTPFKAYKNAI